MSIIPRLIHPINVSIKRLDVATTVVDDFFDEPDLDGQGTKFNYLDSIIVKGQVAYSKFSELASSKGGDVPKGDGHIIFNKVDIDGLDPVLKKNDLIISIANVDCIFFIIDIQPFSHYDKPYFYKIVFTKERLGLPNA